MSANYKFSGSAFLQKELQGVAGFVAFQECHRRGESTTKAVLEDSMAAQYFGDADDDDSIGLTEQLRLKNLSPPLLQQTRQEPRVLLVIMVQLLPVVLTVAGGEVLVLKPELHGLGEDKRITVGGASGITMSLLSAPSLKINASSLQGRTLLCQAQEHIWNGKKALSIVHCYDSPYKSFSLTGYPTSGMTIKDYYMFVRRNMHALL